MMPPLLFYVSCHVASVAIKSIRQPNFFFLATTRRKIISSVTCIMSIPHDVKQSTTPNNINSMVSLIWKSKTCTFSSSRGLFDAVVNRGSPIEFVVVSNHAPHHQPDATKLGNCKSRSSRIISYLLLSLFFLYQSSWT